jgi:hypothetical protein
VRVRLDGEEVQGAEPDAHRPVRQLLLRGSVSSGAWRREDHGGLKRNLLLEVQAPLVERSHRQSGDPSPPRWSLGLTRREVNRLGSLGGAGSSGVGA